MVVVRCLILSSKFAKNRLSPGPLEELTVFPQIPSWIMGKGRGRARWKGRRGRGKKGHAEGEEGKEGKGKGGEGHPGYTLV